MTTTSGENEIPTRDTSLEVNENSPEESSFCIITTNNLSENNICYGKQDIIGKEIGDNSWQNDTESSLVQSVDFAQEAPSPKFVSAGQIRARCSSAKNLQSCLNEKILKESVESSMSEESVNALNKRQIKSANLLKKSPGLALRLSKNPICDHDATNGKAIDEERNFSEPEEDHIKADSDDVSSQSKSIAIGSEDLIHYESQLITKEREEKLERIAKIDLLYQKQIESEMNAGIEAHLMNKDVENDSRTTPATSSHVKTSDASSTGASMMSKKPSFLIDPSLGPKRKTKPGRPIFSRFPGKSVNLPSVEDGLSSGNASADDDDDADGGGINLKDKYEIPNSGLELSRADNIGDACQGSKEVPDHCDSSEEILDKMEDLLESLHLKHASIDDVDPAREDNQSTKVLTNNNSDDLNNSSHDHRLGCEVNRPDDEITDIKDQGNVDERTKLIDNLSTEKTSDDGREIRDTISDDDKDCDAVKSNLVASFISASGDASVNPRDTHEHSTTFANGDAKNVESDSFTPADTSSQSICTTSASRSITTSAEIHSTLPSHYNEPNEIKSELPSEDRIATDKRENESEIKKYPKVPLPRIRTSSSTMSPSVSTTDSLKSLQPQKIVNEVFELQPILGIPLKLPQVHRSPSPCSGKIHSSSNERTMTGAIIEPTGPDHSESRGGQDLNSSEDVENAIRDIKSAILKSKNIKLSFPQQMDEVSASNQMEPVWITRQPQDLGRSYGRGFMPSSSLSSTTNKNFQGQQELNCNSKSSLPSEDEGEKHCRTEDNYYITKGLPGFPVYQSHMQQSPAPDSCNKPSAKGLTTIQSLNHPLQRPSLYDHGNPFRRSLEGIHHPPLTNHIPPIQGWDVTEHAPYMCNRYDCHECRDFPDDFEDEDDDEEEDDDDVIEEVNDDDEGEENYEDEVLKDYRKMKESTCRCGKQGNCHHHHRHRAESSMVRYGKIKSVDTVNDENIEYFSPKQIKNGETIPEYSTDEETDNLLKKQYNQQEAEDPSKQRETSLAKLNQIEQRRNRAREVALRDPSNESVLIEGVLFRANYLGSTQLISEGHPSKAMRMMQAQEAVGRIKAPEGESQPSTEVDLFVSVEKIMVLNTNLQEIMMDHALRTISYIADIGDILVIMARRGSVVKNSDSVGPRRTQTKICCHVFESEEAQLVAQSIGQAFQVSYVEFLKANGIEETSNVKNMDYQDVLNQQEVYGEELYMLSNKDMQREVIVSKVKGETLGVVVVESGWGSMIPTVVLANMAPCGAAARCNQLNIGDQIISINGISMVGLPLTTCQSYIKAAKSQSIVKLTVVSCPPVVEVLIKRPDVKYQLGFSVQNGVICSLLRGGIAERGGVRVGHRIIEINGHSVVATHHEKIVNMLATSAGEIHMKTMPTSIFQLLTGQIVPHYI